MAAAPATIGQGSGSARIGNSIYITRGNNQPQLYRYNIATNNWTTLANAPANIVVGGALTTNGTDLYALRGASTTAWKYTVATNTWSAITVLLADNATGGALILCP